MFLQKYVPVALVICLVSIAGIQAEEHKHKDHDHDHDHGKKAEGAKKADGAKKEADAAIIAKQTATYPLKTCVVSGDTLGGEMGDPVDFVYKKRLVRFCCKGCIKEFKKDSAKFLKKLDDASSKGKDAAKDHKHEGSKHGDHDHAEKKEHKKHEGSKHDHE